MLRESQVLSFPTGSSWFALEPPSQDFTLQMGRPGLKWDQPSFRRPAPSTWDWRCATTTIHGWARIASTTCRHPVVTAAHECKRRGDAPLDNVTHSLIGLNLAHAFFKRRFPEAVPALLLSSNLPDIDGAVLLSHSPLAVTWRRTFGHSVLLLPLWALVLAWLLRRRYRSSSLIALWLLCLLGAYTHLLFDLINSF